MKGMVIILVRQTVIYITTEVVVLLTEITAAQKEVAISYHRVSGLYFLTVIFAATIVSLICTRFRDAKQNFTITFPTTCSLLVVWELLFAF